MSVTGPDFLALMTTDVEGVARFYEERLGLRRAPASPPGAVVFATTPIPFAIRGPLAGVDLSTAQPRPGVGVALWLHADDPDALHARLAQDGVPVLQPITDSPFGRMFSIEDPAGYVVTIHGDANPPS